MAMQRGITSAILCSMGVIALAGCDAYESQFVAGAGAGSDVRTFAGSARESRLTITAFDPAFTGGVRVATGDVNGDGLEDIVTGSGPGEVSQVLVFGAAVGDSAGEFIPYGPEYRGGVFVATGDVNGDGTAEIIAGSDEGSPAHVKVFSAYEETASFLAFGPEFTGGVRVAAGDVNGDGHADIIAGAGPGAGPHVKVFDGRTQEAIGSFLAFGPTFAGGVFVAAGDITGDGRADVIVGADAGAAPHVVAFDANGFGMVASFFAYDPGFSGGVRVATGDVNSDGQMDIITAAGPGGGPHIKSFDGATRQELMSMLANDPTYTGGIFVAHATGVPAVQLGGLAGLSVRKAGGTQENF